MYELVRRTVRRICPITLRIRRMSSDMASDHRIIRTRESLLAAFAYLMQQRSYGEIRVADIADQANVVRSTFYKHFRSKEEVLLGSIEGPFTVLAGCAVGACTPRQLRLVLQHFWDRRTLIRN